VRRVRDPAARPHPRVPDLASRPQAPASPDLRPHHARRWRLAHRRGDHGAYAERLNGSHAPRLPPAARGVGIPQTRITRTRPLESDTPASQPNVSSHPTCHVHNAFQRAGGIPQKVTMTNPVLESHLPSGPIIYLLVVAIVIASSVPVLAIVAAAEPFLMAAVVLTVDDGHTSTWEILTLTIAASVTGDSLSYWLGRQFGTRLFSSRFFNRYRTRAGKAHTSIRRHGMWMVIVQKWLPPTRGLIPAIIGANRLPFITFAGFATASALIWATILILGTRFGGINLVMTLLLVATAAVIADTARRWIIRRRSQTTKTGAGLVDIDQPALSRFRGGR
jgi:membrane-associated protein